jgi:hypothetical protein
VENIISDFRNLLFKQLDDPEKAMQDQMKTITLLLELGSDKDPVSHFLSSANTQLAKIFHQKLQAGILSN